MPVLFALTVLWLIAITIGVITTPYMGAATFAYLTMLAGLQFRKSKTLHARLMLFALLTDISLVLILAVMRDAVQTAISFKLGFLQQSHVILSSLALVFYFPILYLGYKLLQAPHPIRRQWHIRLGQLAFVFRTLGFILMFSLL